MFISFDTALESLDFGLTLERINYTRFRDNILNSSYERASEIEAAQMCEQKDDIALSLAHVLEPEKDLIELLDKDFATFGDLERLVSLQNDFYRSFIFADLMCHKKSVITLCVFDHLRQMGFTGLTQEHLQDAEHLISRYLKASCTSTFNALLESLCALGFKSNYALKKEAEVFTQNLNNSFSTPCQTRTTGFISR